MKQVQGNFSQFNHITKGVKKKTNYKNINQGMCEKLTEQTCNKYMIIQMLVLNFERKPLQGF